MNNLQKRFLLFLFGCISLRLSFVLLAKHIDEKYLPYLGTLALFPAIGFFYIYINNLRKTGGEVFGDKIWWNSLRPIHGALYLIFALYSFTNKKDAWIPLLIDVSLGLTSFLSYHFYVGNINKLLNM